MRQLRSNPADQSSSQQARSFTKPTEEDYIQPAWYETFRNFGPQKRERFDSPLESSRHVIGTEKEEGRRQRKKKKTALKDLLWKPTLITCIAIISLLAAAWRIDCWNAAPDLAKSFLRVSGDSVDCLEELVLLKAGLDLPSFVLDEPEWCVCRMFWFTMRVPDLSMSKSLGSSEGWWTRCWFNSSRESSSFRIFLRTGFWSRLVRRSKSVWTWEATPLASSLVETLCCTRSSRARALLASTSSGNQNMIKFARA